MALFYICLGFAVLSLILFLVVRLTTGGAYGIITKALASFAFVLLAMMGLNHSGANTYAVCIVLGLVCGLVGDIILDNKVVYKQHENIFLNAGMLSFGVGHLFYFIATVILFSMVNAPSYLIYIALAGSVLISSTIFCLSKPLGLSFGKFFLQSLSYTLILSFMSIYSVMLACYNANAIIFAIGICLIFVSDLVLSMQYFGGKADSKFLTFANHLIYYAGQILIASVLFFI